MPKINPISYKIFTKFLESKGFKFIRQKGDHLIYAKTEILRPLVIPMYDQLPVFIIKNNLRSANIDREEYLKFFKK
jgi:predicted RNA binding protein YcfA (HicA-like mRNA interferase family)